MRSMVRLNRDALMEAINRQGLKQWWVAEVAGVHKTTLRRWLSGRISRVRKQHAEQLTAVLGKDGVVFLN